MSQLTVSLSPHVRSGATTRRIMLDVCLALLPAVIFAVYWFGFGVLLTVLLSVASAILSEFLMEKALRRPVTIDDGSAAVTGADTARGHAVVCAGAGFGLCHLHRKTGLWRSG